MQKSTKVCKIFCRVQEVVQKYYDKVADTPDTDNTLAFADALYSGVQLVSEYMKSRSDMIESVLPKSETGHRDAAIKGLWFRARAWMSSLENLEPHKTFSGDLSSK